MEIRLEIAGMIFCFQCETRFQVTGLLRNFLTEEKRADVIIRLQKQQQGQREEEVGFPSAEDEFYRYYKKKDGFVWEIKGAKGSTVARISADHTMKNLQYDMFQCRRESEMELNGWVFLLPMRRILQQLGANLVHAVMVETEGKGLLFTGPSGIGKSTQGDLWQKYMGAKLLCNDRTILRKTEEGWLGFGFYEDGSDPVGTRRGVPVGAIVVLKQESDNKLGRICDSRALRMLLEQTFLEIWDSEMMIRAADSMLQLLREVPVYELGCRPDVSAVMLLKEQLQRDGVME